MTSPRLLRMLKSAQSMSATPKLSLTPDRRRESILDFQAPMPIKKAAAPATGRPSAPVQGVPATNAPGGGAKARWDALMREVGGGVSVSSGYRSPAEQKVIWDRTPVSRRGTWVAAPGKSNHQKMIDGVPGAQDLKFASPAVKDRVHKLAGKYGFRFPMPYEDWHIEPNEARR